MNDNHTNDSAHEFTQCKEDGQNLYQGVAQIYRRADNGLFFLAEAGFYRDGKREGTWETYHPSRALASKAFYRRDLLEDVFVAWDEQGKLSDIACYRGGKKIHDGGKTLKNIQWRDNFLTACGLRRDHDPVERSDRQASYVLGKNMSASYSGNPARFRFRYYPYFDEQAHHEIVTAMPYRDGVQAVFGDRDKNGLCQGPVVQYGLAFGEPVLQARGFHQDDVKEGEWFIRMGDDLTMNIAFHKGERHGTVACYLNNRLGYRHTYKHGVLDGPTELCSPKTGKTVLVHTFQDGEIAGPFEMYDEETNKLVRRGNYYKFPAAYDGLYEENYPDGTRKHRSFYTKGEMTGLTIDWAPDGRLTFIASADDFANSLLSGDHYEDRYLADLGRQYTDNMSELIDLLYRPDAVEQVVKRYKNLHPYAKQMGYTIQ